MSAVDGNGDPVDAEFGDAPRPVGPILDELGVRVHLGQHDRIVQALMIAKTVDLESGDISLVVASNGLDWIEQAGLLAAIGQVQHGQFTNLADD